MESCQPTQVGPCRGIKSQLVCTLTLTRSTSYSTSSLSAGHFVTAPPSPPRPYNTHPWPQASSVVAFLCELCLRGLTQGQERGRRRPTGWALALRGESGRIGEGSELPTKHSRPHALEWERGSGDKGKNSRGQLTYDPVNRRCKPLQDKRA